LISIYQFSGGDIINPSTPTLLPFSKGRREFKSPSLLEGRDLGWVENYGFTET